MVYYDHELSIRSEGDDGLEHFDSSNVEQDFRQLVENQTDLVVKVDLAGRFLYVSPSYCRTFGMSVTDLLGKMFMPLVHEDDRESTAQALATIFYPPYHCYLEQRAMTIEGWRWLAWQNTLLLNEAGEAQSIIGVGRDITARKNMEETLRKLKEQLEVQVELRTEELSSANEELLAMNEEITAANRSLENMNQQLEEEVVTRQRKEEELLVRENQYRAITSFLLNPLEQTEELMRTILSDALHLVQAPEGCIGLYNEKDNSFVIHYATGSAEASIGKVQAADVGIRGEVFRTGETVWAKDYRTYPGRLEEAELARVTTIIIVPLRQAGRVVGALCANWIDKEHETSPDELAILRQYGDFASVAIERSVNHTKITHQNHLLHALSRITNSVVGQLELENILHEILERTSELIGLDSGFVLLMQPDEKALRFTNVKGRHTEKYGAMIPVSGLAAEVMKSGEVVYLQNYNTWPGRIAAPFFDEIISAVQAPLIVDGKPIGVIGLASFGEVVKIDEEQLSVLGQFAQVASLALKNAFLHKKTKSLAFHDTLTGLPNRASLAVHLTEELQRAKLQSSGGAVIFIDIDDLKMVNDNYGHSFGDAVIIAAGHLIQEAVGTQGTFVARIGGDEFIVSLYGRKSREEVADLADRLIQGLSMEYAVSGEHIYLSASLGIAFYPQDGDNTEDILKNADSAMYAAKAKGKSCWCSYDPHIGEESYKRMILTNSLRKAVERNELSLEFQPLVLCKGFKIVGFEALLRWNSPEHGLVTPDRFIPLAEQSGLIHSIGQYVLTEACHFMKRLNDQGFADLRVAVNISPRQLVKGDFVEMLCASLAEAGIAADQLEIEVTENVLIESMEESIPKLLQLKKMGVHLALDDFGTGYSSLTYLRHLPVNTLKIDKSFIDPILEDASQEKFVRFIIEMAHSLNMQVVAEGVEQDQQVSKLAMLGCDILQGYVFSRPVSEAKIILLLSQHLGSIDQ
jgi:diguanylate cyclase (GGDEF)-like protein/PAS domain S-box-containing protein